MLLSNIKNEIAARPVLTIVLVVILLRLPSSFQSVIDWDESIFIVVARELLNGYLPYTAVFDHKPLGLYYLFAAVIGLLGDDPFAVRLLGIAVVAGTSVLLRQFLMSVGGLNPQTALTLALAYAVATGGLGGASVNTEILVNFLTLCWLTLILMGVRSGGVWMFLGAGALMGMSFQISYLTGLLIVGFSVGYLLMRLSRDGEQFQALQSFVIDGLVIFCGFLLANIVLLLPLLIYGDMAEYIRLQYAYLANYKPTVSTTESLERFFETGQAFLPLIAIIWFGWAIGGRRPQPDDIVKDVSFAEVSRLMLPILVAALFALSASFRFYQHYFLLLLPAIFVLAGLVFARFPDRSTFYRFGVVLVVVASFNLGIRGFIEAGKGAAVAAQLAFSDDVSSDRPRALARKIRPLLSDGDSIYVACEQTILYQLTGVSPPTQFAHYPHALMPSYAEAFEVEISDTIDRILDKRPRVIVLGNLDRCRKVPESVWLLLEEKIQFARYEFFQDYRGGRLFVTPSAKRIRFSSSED